ncbi:hypothetical protein TNIN_486281 [Trichonephila inaurata madagascariensis]|uniref:RNase H type-1 domain-containing protein n=1 Tax=Trichonephila inaurata madagascariensis TaxID=2747483 RepID=A0A8X7BZV9_9ARAC|nr:hypothetical protein TNIN_486281 [Trichonephila inaurata madagascariensis]
MKKYINLNDINKGKGLVIHCHSWAVLEVILHGHSRITQEIHRLLQTICRMRKTCTMQRMPAHVGIEGNEATNELSKEARDLTTTSKAMLHSTTQTPLNDID